MTTTIQVQWRSGTASQIAAFTGASAEIAVDTTNNRVVVQDGATAGGWAAAKLSEVWTTTATQAANAVLAGPASGSAAAPTFRSLVGADLPDPASGSLGGVKSSTAPSNQFMTGISTAGSATFAQPTFANLSGVATATQIAGRTAVSDIAYAVLATDKVVAYSALTASRIVSLPASSSYPAGFKLTIVDESGAASPSIQINITPNGTDTINGVNAAVPIQSAYGYLTLESNQTGGWTVIGGAVASTVLANGTYGSQNLYEVIELSSGSLTSGSSYTFANAIPANCIVLGCSLRVTTTVTPASGTPTLELGYTGTLSAFGSSLALTAGTTNVGLIALTAFTAATNVVLTLSSSTFTAGAVRIALHLMKFTPPQS